MPIKFVFTGEPALVSREPVYLTPLPGDIFLYVVKDRQHPSHCQSIYFIDMLLRWTRTARWCFVSAQVPATIKSLFWCSGKRGIDTRGHLGLLLLCVGAFFPTEQDMPHRGGRSNATPP